MNLAQSLFALGGAAALIDWIAVARTNKFLEYVFKPAALLFLLLSATAAPDGPGKSWVIAALALSLIGDVALMLPADLFIAGLGSFLLAHLAFIIGFASIAYHPRTVLIAIPLLVMVGVGVARPVFRALRQGDRPLMLPVGIYIAAIIAMAATAIGTHDILLGMGALLFMASDSLIAHDRFVRSRTWQSLTIIATYHLAQMAFVASVIR